MVRLIVDDAGNRRAFNVGEGRLSIGSGPEAKLMLSAPGIATVHAEIEVHGGKATLHPKPGVTPPQVLGRAANGPVVLQHGVPVKLGGATVTVEYEGQPAKVGPVQRGGASAGGVRSRRDSASEDDDERPARAPRKSGVPTWVWIAVGIPLLAGAGVFVMSNVLGDSAGAGAASAHAYYVNAIDRKKNAQYPQALEQLARIPEGAVLEPKLAADVAALRKELETMIAQSDEQARNMMFGQQYFDTQLKGFVERYMSAQTTSAEARVFMRRAKYFREKWPTHTELDWVTRQEARFKGAIDLSKPPTFDDIKFEVGSLTWDHPANYREAFVVVNAFQASATGADAQNAAAFIVELEAKRSAWFTDRMEQARFHFERKEQSKSVGTVLSIIRFAGVESMEDAAADQLMRFGDMLPWFRGYRTNDPDGFAVVSKNRIIAEFLKENKF